MKNDKMHLNGIISNGSHVLIDPDLFEYLSQFSWSMSRSGYAKRCQHISYDPATKKQTSTSVYMHKDIMGLDRYSDIKVDHINGNKLDNRRVNLRRCTQTENNRNVAPYGKASKYKGVSLFKRDNVWVAQITVNYKHINLGRYTTELQAAKAYNEAALKHFGEFAWLNEV